MRDSTTRAACALSEVKFNGDVLHRPCSQSRAEHEVKCTAVLVECDGGAQCQGNGGLRDGGGRRGRKAIIHELELSVWGDEGKHFVAGPPL